MTFDRMREIGGWFSFASGIAIVLFMAALKMWARNRIPVEWAVALLLVAVALCGIGIWLTPEFWWGRARFTTELQNPEHVVHLPHRAQQGAQADRPASGGPSA